jgi:hypothetical protein
MSGDLIPPGAWMFVLYGKDKRQSQDNQDEVVQTRYREQKTKQNKNSQ